jgi:hypothetical protein
VTALRQRADWKEHVPYLRQQVYEACINELIPGILNDELTTGEKSIGDNERSWFLSPQVICGATKMQGLKSRYFVALGLQQELHAPLILFPDNKHSRAH